MIARMALLASALLALSASLRAQGIEYTDGTTRYRVPFDFLLALLAASTAERLLSAWRYRSATRSAAASAENDSTAL